VLGKVATAPAHRHRTDSLKGQRRAAAGAVYGVAAAERPGDRDGSASSSGPRIERTWQEFGEGASQQRRIEWPLDPN
jgi:hypothetical protein